MNKGTQGGLFSLLLVAGVAIGQGTGSAASLSSAAALVDAAADHHGLLADPYPLKAAGWGPEAGAGKMASRWAEAWISQSGAAQSMPVTAIPLGGDAALTLSGELRIRHDHFDNWQLIAGQDQQQGLLRAIGGAELRLNPQLRVYGELGIGQVDRHQRLARANFHNDGSLQQLFVDIHQQVGNALIGAMIGRQEFADGPRQLISLGDGANLHRSWNGARFYLHQQQYRLGAVSMRATALAPGVFDEEINDDERLQGVNASVQLYTAGGGQFYLDPFWLRSHRADVNVGGLRGVDARDSLGLRFWGGSGVVTADWTLAWQRGDFAGRQVAAWGLFAIQGVRLGRDGWQPRATLRLDVASGGGVNSGPLNLFHPLYASSNYLSEGQFLGLSNLRMVTPGLALSPSATTRLAIDYGVAQRFDEQDAVYAGGLRAYAGTGNVPGKEIGSLLRLSASWAVNPHLTLFSTVERFNAGRVLERTQRASARYVNLGLTYRY